MTRYFGKICERHPELNGERRTASRECLGCQRDRKKRRTTSPEGKAARLEKDRETRELVQFAKTMRRVVDGKILNRQIRIQQERKAFNSPHVEFRQEAIDQLRAEGEIPS